jgi:hypothetical protein
MPLTSKSEKSFVQLDATRPMTAILPVSLLR